MKCAFELQLIAEVKAAEIAKEKAEREERERLAREKRTLAFCEELGERLENKASAGLAPEISFTLLNRWKDEYHPATPTYGQYADGRLSYDYNYKNDIDWNLLVEWFKQYCFKIEYSKELVWVYGESRVCAYKVHISPEPKC